MSLQYLITNKTKGNPEYECFKMIIILKTSIKYSYRDTEDLTGYSQTSVGDDLFNSNSYV
jgi:hypothetical protein